MVAKIGLPPLLVRGRDEDRGSEGGKDASPTADSPRVELSFRPAKADRRCSEMDRRLRGEDACLLFIVRVFDGWGVDQTRQIQSTDKNVYEI